jgi:hypothetical protein
VHTDKNTRLTALKHLAPIFIFRLLSHLAARFISRKRHENLANRTIDSDDRLSEARVGHPLKSGLSRGDIRRPDRRNRIESNEGKRDLVFTSRPFLPDLPLVRRFWMGISTRWSARAAGSASIGR